MAGIVLTCNFQNTDVQNLHAILHLISDVLSIGAKRFMVSANMAGIGEVEE